MNHDDISLLSYAEAQQELQSILQNIQQENIDIDALAQQIERARRLVEFCRSRLRKTETEINQLFDGWEEQSHPSF